VETPKPIGALLETNPALQLKRHLKRLIFRLWGSPVAKKCTAKNTAPPRKV